MIKRRLAILLGDFNWNRPPWVTRAASRVRSHRLLTTAITLAVVVAASGGWWTWNWYQRQPKPKRVSVTVEPIRVTKLEKDLHPGSLTIVFDSSAAKLEQIGKPVSSGIRLEPATAGEWSWKGDRRLTFEPKNDWPADQKYRVTLAKSLFPRHVLLDRYTVDVPSPAFAASLKESEFYQDPRDPAIKQVVATLEFTHSVDRAMLENHIALSLLGGSPVFKEGDAARPFAVTYGLHDRLAYIRSVPLQLPEREDFMRVKIAKGIATTQGGALTHEELQAKVRVPDIGSFFKIEESKGKIVRNEDGQPEQLLIIGTTAAARSEDIQKSLHVYLLPKKTDETRAETKPAADEG